MTQTDQKKSPTTPWYFLGAQGVGMSAVLSLKDDYSAAAVAVM